MDLDFTTEDNLFREEVRSWLSQHIPREPRPLEGPAALEFDRAWQRAQYDAGWAGISWPETYGGRGLPIIQQMIWIEEYSRLDAPPIGSMTVALNHAGPTLISHGTGEQKVFHLGRILKGESVWCQGFSEPGAGSDLAGLRTSAAVDCDHLVINGSKIWTSYAHQANYQELLVRTDPGGIRQRGITWLICDMHSPGVEIRPIINLAGSHEFNQVFYNSVRVPIANVVGAMNEGWRVAMATLDFERGTGTIHYQMELARQVEKLIDFARKTFGSDGRMLIADDGIAMRLAQTRAEVSALRAMTYMNVSRALRRSDVSSESAIVGLYNSRLQQKVGRLAFDLLSAKGLEVEASRDNWTRRYLSSFAYAFAGGTAEIRRNIIGERGLELPRLR